MSSPPRRRRTDQPAPRTVDNRRAEATRGRSSELLAELRCVDADHQRLTGGPVPPGTAVDGGTGAGDALAVDIACDRSPGVLPLALTARPVHPPTARNGTTRPNATTLDRANRLSRRMV